MISTHIVLLKESEVSKHAEPDQQTASTQEHTAHLVHVVFLQNVNKVNQI